jgi:hypothetical protein
MIRRKRSASDIAVPQNVYRHLQAGFAESNARRCVEYDRDRIFHPGDAFIDVLRWLWGGIDSPLTSGESLACTLLADLRIPIESVHPFRSNPYSGSGVFVHLAGWL